MLDQEQILRFDNITEVIKRMPKCFTSAGQFIGSSIAKNNGSQLKTLISENNIDRIIVEDIVLGYLFRNKQLTKNFEDQVKVVLSFFF